MSCHDDHGVTPTPPPSPGEDPAAAAGATLPPLAWQDVDLRCGGGGNASVNTDAVDDDYYNDDGGDGDGDGDDGGCDLALVLAQPHPHPRDGEGDRDASPPSWRLALVVADLSVAPISGTDEYHSAWQCGGLRRLGLCPRRLGLRPRGLGLCSGCALADLSCALVDSDSALIARAVPSQTWLRLRGGGMRSTRSRVRLQNATIKQQKAAAAAAAVAAAAAEVQCGRNPQHPKAHLPAAGDERGGPTGDGANRVRRRTRARGGPVNSAMRVN